MKKIILDEKNVGTVINCLKNFMKKQFRLQKLQYDINTKKWVMTLEMIYPAQQKAFPSKIMFPKI